MFAGWSKLVAEGGEFEILIFLKRMIEFKVEVIIILLPNSYLAIETMLLRSRANQDHPASHNRRWLKLPALIFLKLQVPT